MSAAQGSSGAFSAEDAHFTLELIERVLDAHAGGHKTA
jgi:hypothetical protein